jgi:hypothetical protein
MTFPRAILMTDGKNEFRVPYRDLGQNESGEYVTSFTTPRGMVLSKFAGDPADKAFINKRLLHDIYVLAQHGIAFAVPLQLFGDNGELLN